MVEIKFNYLTATDAFAHVGKSIMDDYDIAESQWKEHKQFYELYTKRSIMQANDALESIRSIREKGKFVKLLVDEGFPEDVLKAPEELPLKFDFSDL